MRSLPSVLVLNNAAAAPVKPVLVKGFQQVVVNLSKTKGRYDTLEGKQQYVVPAVMLTEGVHEGSQGKLLYPADELGRTPSVWDHKPICVYHPTKNGQGVSACDPDIINSRKIGVILNTKFDGRLSTEAWIDIEKCKQVDDRILPRIEKGEMIELSTGLWSENESTSGEWKGEAYTAIARNYKPDHLAILPDQFGACSVADGAGLNRNAEKCSMCDGTGMMPPEDKMTSRQKAMAHAHKSTDEHSTGKKGQTMNKAALIMFLITNGEGLFMEADRAFLEGKSELQLNMLKDNLKDPKVKEVENAVRVGAAGVVAPVLNATPTPEVKKAPTLGESLETLHPDIRKVVVNAINAENRQKEQLIKAILVNKQNTFKQETLANFDLEHLLSIAALAVPIENKEGRIIPLFAGMGGEVLDNSATVTETPMETVPVMFDAPGKK